MAMLFCSRKENRISGTWKLDAKQSTDIDPWRDLKLEIVEKDSIISIAKTWSRGRYIHEEIMDLKLGGVSNQIPVKNSKWPDNPHLGVFVKPNTTKYVVADWLEIGKKLKVESKIELETSQSSTPISIESVYQLSQSGSELALTETRSSRPKPVVYVFYRI